MSLLQIGSQGLEQAVWIRRLGRSDCQAEDRQRADSVVDHFATGRQEYFALVQGNGRIGLTLLASTTMPQLCCDISMEAVDGCQLLSRGDPCSAAERNSSLKTVRAGSASRQAVRTHVKLAQPEHTRPAPKACYKKNMLAQNSGILPDVTNSSHALLLTAFASREIFEAHKQLGLMPATPPRSRLGKFGAQHEKRLRVDC